MTRDPLERAHSTANIALVTLFLAVISLPLAANLAGFDGADPGAENRELATFPTIRRSWSAIARFPATFR